MRAQTGQFVRSAAGHDKDQIFFILREDAEYVYLVDGRCRTLKSPKKKNKKHVKPLGTAVLPFTAGGGAGLTDEAVKYVIKRNPW